MMETQDPSQVILDDAALAKRWGLETNTIRIRRMRGELPRGFKIGRFNRFRLSDVLAYEESLMEEN